MRISALLAGLRIIKLGDCRRMGFSHPQQDVGLAGRMGSVAKKCLLTWSIHHVGCVDSRGGVNGRDEGLNAGGRTLRVGSCN